MSFFSERSRDTAAYPDGRYRFRLRAVAEHLARGEALRRQPVGLQARGEDVRPPGPVPPVVADLEATWHRDQRAVPDFNREAPHLLQHLEVCPDLSERQETRVTLAAEYIKDYVVVLKPNARG